MLFNIHIQTNNAASFMMKGSVVPAWFEEFEGRFELPFHWGRKECVASLINYFKGIEVVPFQNLAGYEEGSEIAEEVIKSFIKLLEQHDLNEEIDLVAFRPTEKGFVAIYLEELEY